MNLSLQDMPRSNQMADSWFPTAVILHFYSAVYYELIPYRQLTYRHKPTGHIEVMPDSMDVIVLSKLEDGNIEVFSKSKLYKRIFLLACYGKY